MTKTLDDFLTKATEVHGDRYDYSKAMYLGAKKNIDIICKEHGLFSMRAARHLSGSNCPKCAIRDGHLKLADRAISKEDYLQRVTTLHDNKYVYDLSDYINCKSRIAITCALHGQFTKVAAQHMIGKGCPKCSLESSGKGFKKSQFVAGKAEAYLYIVKLKSDNEVFFKIGISKNLATRFKKVPYIVEYKVVYTSTPDIIWELEKKLQRLNQAYSYTPTIKFYGYTECFSNLEEETWNIEKHLAG